VFLKRVIEKNAELVDFALKLVGCGDIKPDTYVIDVDTLLDNSAKLLEAATYEGIELYFMTKQIGRNPYISQRLLEQGYRGAVCVDYKEALHMIEHDIQIGHVGHLVQIPKNLIETILKANPEIITVYTVQKAMEISEVASRLNKCVKLMLRVVAESDYFYDAQVGGFRLDELEASAMQIMSMDGVQIKGVTSFPCFVFDDEKLEVVATPNTKTLCEAQTILEALGNTIEQVNMPSNTSIGTIPLIRSAGGTHAEPGHGLTGTVHEQGQRSIEEIPAMVYVSEISHNDRERAWFYGGGHYRRSHMESALVGKTLNSAVMTKVHTPKMESIDYHFELEGSFDVSTPVLCAFRTQVFVTRSEVALVKGLKAGCPELIGIYDANGKVVK